MTPDELRAWRQRAGLSQPGLAALLGVHPMTISRWELGQRAIPTFLDLALEALTLHAQPITQPTRISPMAHAYIALPADNSTIHVGEPRHDRRYRAKHPAAKEGRTLCGVEFHADEVQRSEMGREPCGTCWREYETIS